MIRLIGFESQNGDFVSKDTGEVIEWSNRLLRCVTDENLGDREYGLKIIQQKLKTISVIKSLGLNENSSELAVDNALKSILNRCILWKIGIVKDNSKEKYDIVGFALEPTPEKK